MTRHLAFCFWVCWLGYIAVLVIERDSRGLIGMVVCAAVASFLLDDSRWKRR